MGWFSRKCVGTLRWESIRTESEGGKPQYMHRAQVPGGWLVETQSFAPNSGGLAFVPDPEHRWTLDRLPSL